MIALWATKHFSLTDDSAKAVLLSGFGGLAVMRSSVFTVKHGEETIPIGLNLVTERLLWAIDQAINRSRASQRMKGARQTIKQAKFDKAAKALPVYMLSALPVPLTAEEQTLLKNKIDALISSPLSEPIKLQILFIELINVCGEQMLIDAVENLGVEIE